ncbi:MAG: T9SS type A sorting domain-containing protein [Lewinellaceae bacterium]|nr:T9SS type A sorting domain-containing protein [Lewinellaceae bacterium]
MKPIKLLMPVMCALFSFATMAQPGALDEEFGSGGIVSLSLGPGNKHLKAMALQSDGKIVLAGDVGSDAALARLNSDGSLDYSFGQEGKVASDFGFDFNGIEAMALQPDGKIVAVIRGSTIFTNYAELIVARYNVDGILDDTFGENGYIIADTDFHTEIGRAVALQPDGKIIVATTADNSTTSWKLLISRFHADGTLDSSFGAEGFQLVSFGEDKKFLTSMALQPDGKIIIAGSLERPALPLYDFALARINSDGSLDPGFGIEGIILTQVSSESNRITFLTLQPDDKILATGFAGNKMALARYNINGSLYNSFGTDGVNLTQIQGLTTYGSSAVLQPDGKVLVGGAVGNDFSLMRYTSEGILDEEFGNGGVVTTEITSSSDLIKGLAIQPDGKVVGAGNKFVIARYLSGLEVATSSLPIPQEAALAYPNPARQTVALRYALPAPGRISIQLLDMNGRLLKTFAENERRGPGAQEETINLPGGLPAGQYILSLSGTGGKTGVRITIQSR